MIKCFLSHSSKDKDSYVRIVAKKIGISSCEFDEFSFEEGSVTLDEILKKMNLSDLFVIFLSENALESKWVQDEIIYAKQLFDSAKIKKIFPIIIDHSIKYNDSRLPQWMRDEYNLRYISRPTVAARRIRQRLRELSWESHPFLKKNKKIFVGINELINKFEERFDDFDRIKPSCVVASGVPSIGRRELLKHCVVKTNISDDSYVPLSIYLNAQESIEDLILKLHDLGFSDKDNILDLYHTDISSKIEIAVDLVKDIISAKEMIFIIDNGCIATFNREISSWFVDIINKLTVKDTLIFCLASKFRIRPDTIRGNDSFFHIEVPELSIKERKGLLSRYSSYRGLSLDQEVLNFFSGLLTGYPEQVFFTVEQLIDLGIYEAKKQSHIIVDYNSNKVQQLLSKWAEDERVIDFLRLLSEFDFISQDVVFNIVYDEEVYVKIITDFRATSIVEFIGANNEYIRVIDNVRDYIMRQKLSLHHEFKDKLNIHVDNFIQNYQNNDNDISDYLYSIKAALLEGKQINERYLIPSIFLKTIKQLYDQKGKYQEVIRLADRVIDNNQNLDDRFLQNVRYYLCLALARLRDARCVQEAQKFKGAEHNFLLGFYYRLKGRYQDAIIRLSKALDEQPSFARARRELVLVLSYIGEFTEALELARLNFENDRSNPYHIQAYINCLLKDVNNKSTNRDKITDLLSILENIQSKTAHEMYLTSRAEFIAFHENNLHAAIELIDDAKKIHQDVIYPLLMEFDIYARYNITEKMNESLKSIEKVVDRNSYFFNSLIRRRCIYIAMTKGYSQAIDTMSRYFSNYTDTAKERFSLLLQHCAEQKMIEYAF